MKFRKKPVIIEAVRLTWDNWDAMCKHAGVGKMADGKPEGVFLDEHGQPVSGAASRRKRAQFGRGGSSASITI